MSKNAQQEIASTYECDTTSPEASNLNMILLYAGIFASIIVFSTGLAVSISSVNKTAGAFMPLILLACLYPCYKLYKLSNFYFQSLSSGLIFLIAISLMMYFIPPDAFKNAPVFAVCFLLLAVITAPFLIAVNVKKFHARELSALITILFFTSLSVLLLIYFKGSSASSLGFMLWAGKVFNLPLKNSAFAFAGITIISIGLIALISYLFMERKQKITTRYITYVATFAALSVVFKLMGNAISSVLWFYPALKFTLVYIPWVAAGIVIGPSGAIIATAIGDFLGQLMLPVGGTWFWLTWVSNVLLPLFPAILYHYLPLAKKYDFLKIIIGMVISSVVCTLGLGTWAIAIQWGQTYMAQLALRPPQLIVIGINCALIIMLLPALRRIQTPLLFQKRSFFKTRQG